MTFCMSFRYMSIDTMFERYQDALSLVSEGYNAADAVNTAGGQGRGRRRPRRPGPGLGMAGRDELQRRRACGRPRRERP